MERNFNHKTDIPRGIYLAVSANGADKVYGNAENQCVRFVAGADTQKRYVRTSIAAVLDAEHSSEQEEMVSLMAEVVGLEHSSRQRRDKEVALEAVSGGSLPRKLENWLCHCGVSIHMTQSAANIYDGKPRSIRRVRIASNKLLPIITFESIDVAFVGNGIIRDDSLLHA